MAERVEHLATARTSSRDGGARPILKASTFEHFVEMVTPEKAAEWMLRNVRNRPISNAFVRRYVRDLQGGLWEYCGDPIRFNGNGDLIDGAHRLKAIIDSGIPAECLIIRGLPLSVQEKIDQGRRRSAGSRLILRGADNGNGLAAAARQLINIKRATPRGSNWVATDAEVLACVDKHPALAEAVGAVGRVPADVAPSIAPSLLSAVYYVGAHLLDDRDTADAFAAVFMGNGSVQEGNPAHLWRERLLAQRSKQAKLTRSSRRVGTIHAWNHFRRGTKLQQFKLPEDATFEDLDVNRI